MLHARHMDKGQPRKLVVIVVNKKWHLVICTNPFPQLFLRRRKHCQRQPRRHKGSPATHLKNNNFDCFTKHTIETTDHAPSKRTSDLMMLKRLHVQRLLLWSHNSMQWFFERHLGNRGAHSLHPSANKQARSPKRFFPHPTTWPQARHGGTAPVHGRWALSATAVYLYSTQTRKRQQRLSSRQSAQIAFSCREISQMVSLCWCTVFFSKKNKN